ncbi:MAG: FG-GAP repeat protein [Acidobacteria bacterium]|nr:FG-GAP repeat protein [Acidobacteriota bacterium]
MMRITAIGLGILLLAGLPAMAGDGPASDGSAPAATPWLHTSGNRILKSDGSLFRGRGANLNDTRGCNACTWFAPNVDEVKRRIDLLVDVWKADFIRLDLESYATADGRVHWQSPLYDDDYVADIRQITDYIGTKPGVYVMVALWIDPSIDDNGWPTATTNQVWAKLADQFLNQPHVMFGIVNEPEMNYDGAWDAQVWQAMNSAVQAIRDRQDLAGAPYNLITVQGTGGWARFLNYYTTHPITAGGGVNVAYEVHVYDPASEFAARFENPSRTIPVIVGEFGPSNMTEAECEELMRRAEVAEVPYLAWVFHMRCPPNLLVDNSGGGCGVGMTLTPTSWGTLLKNRLAVAWKSAPTDFNDDGKTDVLWRNLSTGDTAIWYLNGVTMSSSAFVANVATGWTIAGTADFNGDGKADIFWRNAATGDNAIWYLSGASVTGSAPFPYVAAGWTVAGFADFNNDGKPDLLWRNPTSGVNTVWYLDGASVTGDAAFPAVAAGWTVAGLADLNGDRKTDVLWRNGSSGVNSVWYLDGVGYTGAAAFPTVSTDWDVAALADFNADGKTDVLWRNLVSGNGALSVWYLSGIAVSGSARLTPNAVPDPNWTVAN